EGRDYEKINAIFNEIVKRKNEGDSSIQLDEGRFEIMNAQIKAGLMMHKNLDAEEKTATHKTELRIYLATSRKILEKKDLLDSLARLFRDAGVEMKDVYHGHDTFVHKHPINEDLDFFDMHAVRSLSKTEPNKLRLTVY
ncbi:MAG: hypothetical protein AAF988_00890, partial [Pseudomonadota bacterium]